jgi:Spy/CpxP family protein refolding chaperone
LQQSEKETTPVKKRNLVLIIVALIALAAVPFVYAQGFHHRHGGGDGSGMSFFRHIDRAKQALNLSDAQVDQIKAIAEDLKTQNVPLRQQMRGGFQSVAQTLIANPNDVAAAQAQLDQQSAVERTIKLNTLNAASRALNVLTADQRAKIAQFLAQREARHQKK